MNITVYSTSTCPYCKLLKDYLNEKGATFTEKLVDQDDNAQKEMLSVSGGFQGVPFTLIENEGKKETIMGFDKGKFESMLGSIGKV